MTFCPTVLSGRVVDALYTGPANTGVCMHRTWRLGSRMGAMPVY